MNEEFDVKRSGRNLFHSIPGGNEEKHGGPPDYQPLGQESAISQMTQYSTARVTNRPILILLKEMHYYGFNIWHVANEMNFNQGVIAA
jgi:hypothetical protein